MTKPLKTIIGVAIFSVNFPLQRKKGCDLLQPFRIFIQVFEDGKLKRKDWLNYMQMAKIRDGRIDNKNPKSFSRV